MLEETIQIRLDELEHTNKLYQMLFQISRDLNKAQTEEAIHDILRASGRPFHIFSTILGYIDLNDDTREPEWLEVVATAQTNGQPAIPTGSRLYLPEFSPAYIWLADVDKPQFLPDILTDPNLDKGTRQIFAQSSVRALVSIPLTQAGEWIGVFVYTWSEPHSFTPGEIQFFEALPGLLSPVIANRRLTSYLREQVQEQAHAYEDTQQLLQLVLDSIPVRVFWKDHNLNYLGCNRLFAQDARLDSPQDVVGKTDADLFPFDAEIYQADDLHILNSGESRMNYEEPQTTPEGDVRWLQTSKLPLRDAAGSLIGILGTYEDVTEQMAAQSERERLTKESEQFRKLVTSINQGINLATLGGRIDYANYALLQLMKEENIHAVRGKSLLDYYPEGLQQQVEEVVLPSVKTTGHWAGELAIQASDGTVIPTWENFSLMVDEQGSPTHIIDIVTDITERKQAEAERERLQHEIIEAQRQALKDLSTPIIPILDQIIVLPLIGSIDTARARDITRSLLEGITLYRAKIVIIDITGVPVVDSGVADHLNKTIQAARLKGAKTIITGLSDAVAETIVDLGIDWSSLETLTDLQTGLLSALHRLDMDICKRPSKVSGIYTDR